MRDALEERLADRLGALGDTVDDELPPPVDLELQVLRRRRHTRATRRWSGVGIAAAIVAALVTVAVVRGTTGRSGTLRIATSSTTVAPVHDALQPGTVMLSARGRYVVSLDANGTRNATMVAVEHGDITYARATDDHRALWYLSLKKGANSCGDVVRADIEGRSSTIVTHAVAFDVSPDGSRLALYGAGDLAAGKCAPVTTTRQGRIVVLDLARRASSALTVGSIDAMRWSQDGSYLVSVSCSSNTCFGYDRIDVAPNGALRPASGALSTYPSRLVQSARIAFGAGGLYALEKTVPFPNQSVPAGETVRIGRIDPRAPDGSTIVFSTRSKWDVSQVIPTSVGIYVVAAPAKTTDTGLYRVESGKLAFVRPLPDAGTLTPVAPLP